MNDSVSRRRFLSSAVATVSMATVASGAPRGPAPARPRMKIGLYSITYLGIWYRGEAMKLKDLMRFVKQEGWEGVELDTKRPHAAPMDLASDDRKELRDLAGELELPICAVSPDSDLSSHIPERSEAMICYVRECIKLTRDLGSPICKVFAGWPGVVVRGGLGDYRYTRDLADPFPSWAGERWERVRESLRELSGFAEDNGVVLALQNHPPITEDEDDVLRMIEEVGSPALKACMDHGTAETVKKTGNLQVHSHYNGEFRKDASGRLVSTHEVGYGPYVDALAASGYDGFMNWEFCHPAMQYGRRAGIDYVHRVTREALTYMKMLREEAEARASAT
jgi:sugar phosphate isomerase/epimerase